jgi:hypothetical protein
MRSPTSLRAYVLGTPVSCWDRQQVKSLGKISLSALLGALALRLVVIEDVEQAEIMRGRWTPRAEQHVTIEGRRRRKAA